MTWLFIGTLVFALVVSWLTLDWWKDTTGPR